MTISTNSIIHFTSEISFLKGILKSGFKIKYCSEKLILSSDTNQYKNSFVAHPMVCFCDIPIKSSLEHVKMYGSYGIGLSKDWANKKGINPVLYINKDSMIAKNISMLLTKRRTKKLDNETNKDIIRIKAFSKNYSGKLFKNGKLIDNEYRFYDEREWRLIPEKEKLGKVSISINNSTYLKDKNKYNAKLDNCFIDFSHTDITYIIVSKTSEIPDIVSYLEVIYKHVDPKEKNILISKIISIEQIQNDF